MTCSMRMAAAIVLAAALSGLHRLGLLADAPLQIAYGLGYAAVALLWLLAWRQCKPDWPTAMHRALALLASTGLALLDAYTSGLASEARQELFFSALLGAAVVQVIAKLRMRNARQN